jgi:Major Facilitator Superfamily.
MINNKKLNKITIKIFAIIGITALCSYIIFPFLAVYFTKKGLSLSQVGLLLGITAFSTAFLGISSTFFERLLGVKKALLLGIIISGMGYVFYSMSNNFIILLGISILQGLGQGITTPLLKKYLALNNKGTENQVFRYRYIIFCIAGIIGPILGNVLSLFTVDFMLKIVGIIYICGIFILNDIDIGTDKEETRNKYTLVTDTKNMNSQIIFFIILSIVIFIEFSIFENVTPLSLQLFSDNAEIIFSALLILNAILALCLQPIFIFLNENLTIKKQAIIGSLSFSIAYLIFALAQDNILLVVIATIIFTLGEALLIPLLDVMISKIVEADKLNTIYAVAELKQLGFFIGPAMAGILMQHFNVTIMYLSIAMLCLFGMAMFFQIAKKYN